MAKKSPPQTHYIQQRLIKTSAYETGRSIIRGTVLLNVVLGVLGIVWAVFELEFVIALAAFSAVLFWILGGQIGGAFFDIADAKLAQTLREEQAASSARANSHNPTLEGYLNQ